MITNYEISMMEDTTRTRNHFKARMRYHIIFSTKYRKKLLDPVRDSIFSAFNYSVSGTEYKIIKMNIDKDHIHLVLEIPPTLTVGSCIHRMKQLTTYYMYKHNYAYMRKFYYRRKRLLWTHGYFVSTIGMVSEDKVLAYIENQGK